jgi:hypothetical protein
LLDVLGRTRHLPRGRHRAGDRHRKFYETRDNLLVTVVLFLSHDDLPFDSIAALAIGVTPLALRGCADGQRESVPIIVVVALGRGPHGLARYSVEINVHIVGLAPVVPVRNRTGPVVAIGPQILAEQTGR